MTNGDDAQAPGAGSYASVNGLEMYYEIHGTGLPLILLHGGVGAIEMFGEVLPLLAELTWTSNLPLDTTDVGGHGEEVGGLR